MDWASPTPSEKTEAKGVYINERQCNHILVVVVSSRKRSVFFFLKNGKVKEQLNPKSLKKKKFEGYNGGHRRV